MLNSISKAENFLIPLVDVKSHLRIDANFDDSTLYQIIQAAQDNARRFLGRALAIETYEFTPPQNSDIYLPMRSVPPSSGIDCYQPDRVTLRVGNITEIVSVNTYVQAGTATNYSVSLFDILNYDQESVIVRKDGTDVPRGTRTYRDLVLVFKAGYTEATLPFGLRQALLMLMGFYYENRDTMVDVNLSDPHTVGIRQMLQKYRLEFI